MTAFLLSAAYAFSAAYDKCTSKLIGPDRIRGTPTGNFRTTCAGFDDSCASKCLFGNAKCFRYRISGNPLKRLVFLEISLWAMSRAFTCVCIISHSTKRQQSLCSGLEKRGTDPPWLKNIVMSTILTQLRFERTRNAGNNAAGVTLTAGCETTCRCWWACATLNGAVARAKFNSGRIKRQMRR